MRVSRFVPRLAPLAILFLFACGGAADGGNASDSPSSGSSGGDAEASQPQGFVARLPQRSGDLDEMIEKRSIVMLTTFNRTGYFLDDAQPKGTVAEAARLFQDFVNERVDMGRLKLDVVIVPVTRGDLLPALADGRGDIAAANLTVTESRREQVDFSDPFLTGVKEVVVTGSKAPQLDSVEDLAGREIWVRPSSSFHGNLEALSKKLEAEGKPAIKIRAADEILETEDLMQMVAAGIYPMTVADSHMADFWGGVLDGLEVRSDLALSEGDSIAWALRKGTPKLAELVNEFVETHKKGTMLGNVVMNRYFKDNKWVRNPLEDRSRLEQHRPSFEKWAAEYDSDWVLAAAQGYQESQLDQSRKSSAGALGIMQMKPSTAADPNVGIPDITKADPNIHAGIKYMRFIRDRYYEDEPMTALNQGLFAIAAYNAGPARINGLRRDAPEKGLDPNVWFGQVEHLAPRETITYVANIFKYYISYNEYLRQEDLKK